MSEIWQRCLTRLESEFRAEDVHTYLAPLQVSEDGADFVLWAPNSYTMETVRERFLERIVAILEHLRARPVTVNVQVGTRSAAVHEPAPASREPARARVAERDVASSNLDPHYTFDNFVEGKSNQLGKAAATQVAMNPGQAYNPLLLYGGTGLGKTHLMHAAGNLIRVSRPDMRVLYLRSEQFVSGMVRALQQKGMDDF
ncbi:MAG TPA: DnaA/Hda family protein, partial [Dokdonella sp.]